MSGTSRRGFLSIGAVVIGAAGCNRNPIEATALPPLPRDEVAPGSVPRRVLGSTGAVLPELGIPIDAQQMEVKEALDYATGKSSSK
jgi:hypothetical protein